MRSSKHFFNLLSGAFILCASTQAWAKGEENLGDNDLMKLIRDGNVC